MLNKIKWFNRSSLFKRLMITFLFIAILAAIISAVGILYIKSIIPDMKTPGALRTMIIMAALAVIGIALSVYFARNLARSVTFSINGMTFGLDKMAVGDLAYFNNDMDIEKGTKNEVTNHALAFIRLLNSTREKVADIKQIAQGDLTTSIHVKCAEDQLGNALQELVDNTHRVISAILTTSEQVASGSNLVANSSQALSQGATHQASSVQELTASLEQISAQTRLNAQNAEKANELAKNAKTNAANGNGQMKDMLKAMDEINVSSSNINKIIKVIEDIAFQTNILALNAAVEAARAGQHGKGFAVVAEEVRSLAAKSANAAKETTDLIEGSIRKVGAGTKIANETAEALNEIVSQVEKAADLIDSIAIASNEQALSIEQVNQGIMQVSQVIQTNAATSEESAAASEELSTQASQLKENVSVFHLKKEPKSYGRNSTSTGRALQQHSSGSAARTRISLSDDNDFGKY
jgi:methyl-accepting chemotaxis protein